MKYKLIASDCDDTMLNDSYGYSDYFKRTLEKYIKAGGKFVIATGRMTSSVLKYCYDLNLHGELITYQGALTTDIDTGEILDGVYMSTKDATALGKYIEDRGFYYHIYDEETFVTERDCAFMQKYAEFNKMDGKAVGIPVSEYIKNNALTPRKLMVLADEDKVPGLIEELKKKFPEGFLFNTSKKWMVEAVPVIANKGIAVKRLAEKYGIRREEVICIGDSANDIPMIEYAGLGVCVENGSREAKAVADIIAPSNENDGVAYIINKYGLGK